MLTCVKVGEAHYPASVKILGLWWAKPTLGLIISRYLAKTLTAILDNE